MDLIKNIKAIILFTLIGLTLIACGSSAVDEGGARETSVSFDYQLSSIYSGQDLTTRARLSNKGVKIYTGDLLAKNITLGEEEIHPWSAYIDEDSFAVTSNKTITLKPGSYEFVLTLANGNNQYVSETVYEIKDFDQVNIPFNLKPVLGDLVTDVNIVAEILSFKFVYDVGEISGYDSPKIGIKIDDDNEKYFNINPATGLSDAYVNIPAGDHNIALNFFDGNIYRGRSSKYPSPLTITAKEDINIDLVPLYGEATLGFDINGSALNLLVNIPSQIVTEAQSLSNLQTIIRYTGANGSGERGVTVVPYGNDYQGSTTLGDIKYGDFSFSLEFRDFIDNNELIGSCDIDTFTVDQNNKTVFCDVTLKQRSNITGNLLATVGINVFNESMVPVEGAKVYADDTYLGLTGSRISGTKGYLKQYIKKGSYTLRAEFDTRMGTKDVTLTTLSVDNYDLILDQDIPSKYISDIPANWWEDTGSVMPESIYHSTSQIIGNYVYTFGGHINGANSNKIFRAPVSDPTSWSDTGSVMPEAIAFSTSQIIGNYVYTFGGFIGTTYSNKIFRAPVSDPTSWSNTGSVMPESIAHTTSQIIGDYVYTFGGYIGSTYSNKIFRAPVSDPTSWSDTSSVMPGIIGYSTSQIIGNYVYTFGGLIGSTSSNNIFRAPVSDPTSWSDTGSVMPKIITFSTSQVIGNYVYTFGSNGGASNEIFRAPISDPTSWSDTGSVMPSSISGSTSQIIGNYVYTFGSDTSSGLSNIIFRAKITLD